MAQPITLTSGICALCNAERLFSDMSVFASAVIGHVGDIGLMTTLTPSGLTANVSGTVFACDRTDWVVGGTCWNELRNDPKMTRHDEDNPGRIWRDQDAYAERL